MVVNERIEIKIDTFIIAAILVCLVLIYALVCLIANELLP